MGRMDSQKFAVDTHKTLADRQKTHQSLEQNTLPGTLGPCYASQFTVFRYKREIGGQHMLSYFDCCVFIL